MGSVYEIVEHEIFNFLRNNFMIAGHTKFYPDSLPPKRYYSADIFNKEFYSGVPATFNSLLTGGIVQYWRDTVTQNYSNLPGIRSYHDFFAMKNPGTSAIMKVRELCYSGTLQNTNASDKGIHT